MPPSYLATIVETILKELLLKFFSQLLRLQLETLVCHFGNITS